MNFKMIKLEMVMLIDKEKAVVIAADVTVSWML
jgi:hypothetical protein